MAEPNHMPPPNPAANDGSRDAPLVTVVICAHNPGEHLDAAVRSALAQTHEHLEVLLIDDGSTDGSIEALRIDDPRLHIHRQENRGKAAALNHALDQMRGDYLAILDADDLAYPERIARQLQAFDAEPSLAVVMCGHDLILSGRRLAPRFPATSPEDCRAAVERCRMPAHDPTAMFRTSAIAGMRFDESLRIGQQYDFLLRIGEAQPMRVLGECLYSYRIHPGSQTKKNPAEREQHVARVIDKARQRRGLPPAEASTQHRSNRFADNNLVGHFVESVRSLRAVGRWREALRTALACWRLHPFAIDYLRPLANCFVRPQTVRFCRQFVGLRRRGDSDRTVAA